MSPFRRRLSVAGLAVVFFLCGEWVQEAANSANAGELQTWNRTILGAPTLVAPDSGTELAAMTVSLAWQLPSDATQYQLQVIPAGNDGPGVNVIQDASAFFILPAPPAWYGLLPGMGYSWRVRATDASTGIAETDPSWGPWSDVWTFRTPKTSSHGMLPVRPAHGTVLSGSGATLLHWSHPDPTVFYFEVQVSENPSFDTSPGATTFVWWNLVHGGGGNPPNSWATPPLRSDVRYFWRVRPRVQGDGVPLGWSSTWSFQTEGSARPTPTPAATATGIPTLAPTPTATPTPGPIPTDVPPNPWGYNFRCCNRIFEPPAEFCRYFECVENFWGGRGYVLQCWDFLYSKSGGLSGPCANHGGIRRALLAP